MSDPNATPAPSPQRQPGNGNAVRGDQRQAQRPAQRLQRHPRNEDRYHIPPSEVPDGMTYQWCVQTVMGQPAREQQITNERNHWTPVPGDRHPWLSGSSTSKEPIIVGGLMLCERPSYLTDEAREEDARAAADQIGSQFRRLTEVPAGTAPRDNRGQSMVKVSRTSGQPIPEDA